MPALGQHAVGPTRQNTLGAQDWRSLESSLGGDRVGGSGRNRVKRGDVGPHLKRQVGDVGQSRETEKQPVCVGRAQWVGKLQANQPGWCGAGWQMAEEARDRVCHTWSLRSQGALHGWSLSKNPFPEQGCITCQVKVKTKRSCEVRVHSGSNTADKLEELRQAS